MAKFKIKKIFRVTNRGLVLSGNITEGEINPGDLIQLSLNGGMIKLKIQSVEYVDSANGTTEIGLIIESLNNNLKTLLDMMADQTVLVINDY